MMLEAKLLKLGIEGLTLDFINAKYRDVDCLNRHDLECRDGQERLEYNFYAIGNIDVEKV